MFYLVLVFFIFLLTFAYAGLRGAPWVPTRKKDVARVLKIANLKVGQRFYDLGCGDGRLVCAAAKAGADAYGLEISLLPFLLAQLRRIFQKNKAHIHLIYRDFWNADLSAADAVYFFLLPKVYPRLKEKLETELKPGAKIIAYVWPMPGWKPATVDYAKNYPQLYLYER